MQTTEKHDPLTSQSYSWYMLGAITKSNRKQEDLEVLTRAQNYELIGRKNLLE